MWDILYLLAVLLLPLAYVLASEYDEKRRSARWRDLATRLGFSFCGRDKNFDPPHSFPLFHIGARYETRNIMVGERGGVKVLVAEYTYRVSLGPQLFASHATCRQTICLFEHAALDLPDFVCLHEAFTRRMGYEPVAPAVEFPDDAVFANAYTVQSHAGEAARALFTPAVRELCKAQRDRQLHLEGDGRFLLVHTEDPIRPEDLAALLTQACERLDLWLPTPVRIDWSCVGR